MAVLSHHELMERVGIENPGPASKDLQHGDIRKVPDPYWNNNFRRLRKGTSVSMPRSQLLENSHLHAEDWMQGGHYFVEVQLPKGIQNYERMFSMRSNMARNGLMGTEFRGVHGVPDDACAIYLRTCGTEIETPNYPVFQIFLREPGTKPLNAKQIRKALDDGDVRVEAPDPKINNYDGNYGSIDLGWDQRFIRYKGGRLTPKCPAADFFEPCSSNGEVPIEAGRFYLGATVKIFVGPGHLGWLIGKSDPRKTLVHMNATGVNPNTYSMQTMEIYGKQNNTINRGEPACELLLFELTSPAPINLKGTYGGGKHYNEQPDGPVPSGIHTWNV